MTRNNKSLKVFLTIAALFISLIPIFTSIPIFAAGSDVVVETTFFGNLKDDGKGCGVYTVLNTAIDIMSIGIGIVGVIGIGVAGIQYLTAGGNEQQTTKSKRRLFEIVIGIIAYALLYAATQWLLPGGKLNTTPCQTVTDEQLAMIRAKEQAEKEARQEARQEARTQSDSSSSEDSGSSKSPAAEKIKASTGAQSIAKAAIHLSWPIGKKSKAYWQHNYNGSQKFKSWDDLGKAKPNKNFRDAFDELYPKHWKYKFPANIGADCGKFVKVVLKYAKKYAGIKDIPKWKSGFINTFSKSKNWKKITNTSTSNLKPGDICISSDHQKIYVGNKKVAEAGNHSKRFGHIHGGSEGNCNGYTVYRYIGK